MKVLSLIIMVIGIASLWLLPSYVFFIVITSLLLSLSLSIYTIFKTHKGTENARLKILKEIGVMVLTLIIVLFLGGIAAMLANAQVGIRWGEVAGLISAIAASFAVGYLVRKGMGRFAG